MERMVAEAATHAEEDSEYREKVRAAAAEARSSIAA